jgi:hypothetical protein
MISISILIGLAIERSKQRKRMEIRRRSMRQEKIKKTSNELELRTRQEINIINPTMSVGNGQIKKTNRDGTLKGQHILSK